MFKTTLLACALTALVGCRERTTRVDDGTSFSRPVESERMTFETPGATEEHTPAPPSGVDTTTPEMQTQTTAPLSETTTNPLPAPAPTTTPTTTTTRPADADDDADTSSIPTTGGTNGITYDPRAGAGDTSGGGARAVTPPVPSPQNYQPGQPVTGQPPVTLDPATPAGEGQGAGANAQTGTQSTGTSETASGHGTPTNTGTNTENAGTGGTDDPTR